MVFYDDKMKNKFGKNVVKRLAAIMALVDEMYSEKDTLKTELEVNVAGIEHADGSNWGGQKWMPDPFWDDLYNIAIKSSKEANLYVFITDGTSQDGYAGLAPMGVVCDPYINQRMSINGYEGSDAYTATVNFNTSVIQIVWDYLWHWVKRRFQITDPCPWNGSQFGYGSWL